MSRSAVKRSRHPRHITFSYRGDSYNFDGNAYGNKYIVSDDNRYIAIGPNIYDLHTAELLKRLELNEDAMGLKILSNAQKVIQINLNQEILIYTRTGKPVFDYVNVNFQKLLDADCISKNYDIHYDGKGKVIFKSHKGNVLGIIHDIDGYIYFKMMETIAKFKLPSIDELLKYGAN